MSLINPERLDEAFRSASPELMQEILNRELRTDLLSFVRRSFEALEGKQMELNWHHKAIAHKLEQVRLGHVKRLLITLPPRNAKSLFASVAFPAWLHGQNPKLEVICTSYNDELAVNFANQWRRILGEEWYQQVFPATRISNSKNKEGETHLVGGGSRLSVSTGGTLTGRGSDIIIIDDPMKAQDAHSEAARKSVKDWFTNTMISRLNDKRTGAIIVVMQRLHAHDLAGELLQSDRWDHLTLPAIAPCDLSIPVGQGQSFRWSEGSALHPEREPLEVLESIRGAMGSHTFNAQYLQRPIRSEGNIVELKNFVRLDDEQLRTQGDARVISVDTANKGSANSDYSVIQCWRISDRKYDLLFQLRGKWDYPDLKAEVISTYQSFGAERVLIEDAGAGSALNRELENEGINSIGITPRGSKEQRLQQALPVIESERVRLPKDTPWLEDFEQEVTAFPAVRNDDQVDAMTQFINWAEENPDIGENWAANIGDVSGGDSVFYLGSSYLDWGDDDGGAIRGVSFPEPGVVRVWD